jgi:hypothetical protein
VVITAVEVIITDGAEATMGDTITIGEIKILKRLPQLAASFIFRRRDSRWGEHNQLQLLLAAESLGDFVFVDEFIGRGFSQGTARGARAGAVLGHSIFQIRTEQFISGVLDPLAIGDAISESQATDRSTF